MYIAYASSFIQISKCDVFGNNRVVFDHNCVAYRKNHNHEDKLSIEPCMLQHRSKGNSLMTSPCY